jgi:hypothetical protein
VIKWSSEEVVVPYFSPVDGREHRYFVDFWIEYLDVEGKPRQKLIEVKPLVQCIKPTGSRFSKGYEEKLKTWVINQAKWETAERWAASRNMEFQVVTERELGIR